MLYRPEFYYIYNQEFPFWKAFLLIAQTVAESCQDYSVEPLVPKKGLQETQKHGLLPIDPTDKKVFVQQLVEWLQASTDHYVFRFYLDGKFVCTAALSEWVLNISPQEFAELQKVWKENGLPEDLFYAQGEDIFVGELDEHGHRLAGKSYTPKEWEMERKKRGRNHW